MQSQARVRAVAYNALMLTLSHTGAHTPAKLRARQLQAAQQQQLPQLPPCHFRRRGVNLYVTEYYRRLMIELGSLIHADLMIHTNALYFVLPSLALRCQPVSSWLSVSLTDIAN